jgi:uncharacterized membrane protein
MIVTVPSLPTSLFLMFAMLAAGCNKSGTSAPVCPDDLPSCPSTVPSYAGEIAPLIQERCFPCHDQGGAAGPNWVLTSYAAVSRQYPEILNQVYSCEMPPADSNQLSASERAALLAWLVCMAPDN